MLSLPAKLEQRRRELARLALTRCQAPGCARQQEPGLEVCARHHRLFLERGWWPDWRPHVAERARKALAADLEEDQRKAADMRALELAGLVPEHHQEPVDPDDQVEDLDELLDDDCDDTDTDTDSPASWPVGTGDHPRDLGPESQRVEAAQVAPSAGPQHRGGDEAPGEGAPPVDAEVSAASVPPSPGESPGHTIHEDTTMSKTSKKPIRECVECGRTMTIAGRGRCSACHKKALRADKAVHAAGEAPQAPPQERVSATGTCLEAGCDRKAQGRGLCSMHYNRHKRAGDLEQVALPPMTRSEAAAKSAGRPKGRKRPAPAVVSQEPPRVLCCNCGAELEADRQEGDRWHVAPCPACTARREANLREQLAAIEHAIADHCPPVGGGPTLDERVRMVVDELEAAGDVVDIYTQMRAEVERLERLKRDRGGGAPDTYGAWLELVESGCQRWGVIGLDLVIEDGVVSLHTERKAPCSP